jgi:hypothetical protein
MNFEEFVGRVRAAVPVGAVIENPGGGTSEVTGFTGENISYVRGSSTISVKLDVLHLVYESFRGKQVTSSELKRIFPAVFDSNARPAGHSCNCTFLFGVLEQAGLASRFSGSGVRGDPYSAVFIDS